MKNKKLTSNMEDYLEAIFALEKMHSVARVKDIAQTLSVKSPSVVSALGTLSKAGFIDHEHYGYVQLTDKGRKLAAEIEEKHLLLFEFLTKILGISDEVAEEDACRIEHVISLETKKRLGCFIGFVKNCPQEDRPEWLKNFDHFCKTGQRLECKRRGDK